MGRFHSSSQRAEARTSISGWQDRAFQTIQRTAAILDISRPSAYALVYKGEIKAATVAGRMVIPTEALKTFIAARAA